MLTARSECHVFGEAAVIRSGNGTLHGEGVYHSFGDKAQRFEARKPTCSLQTMSLWQGNRESLFSQSLASCLLYGKKKRRLVVSCDHTSISIHPAFEIFGTDMYGASDKSFPNQSL